MGYRLNRLDEPVLMAVSKALLTEFGIHYRLESCVTNYTELRIRTLSERQFIFLKITAVKVTYVHKDTPFEFD